jgi:hypothetical protein
LNYIIYCIYIFLIYYKIIMSYVHIILGIFQLYNFLEFYLLRSSCLRNVRGSRSFGLVVHSQSRSQDSERRSRSYIYIVTRRMVDVTKCRILVLVIGFISTLVTHSLLITLRYMQYRAVADVLTHCQFTVANALGFSIFSSRLLATDLNKGTSTSDHSRYHCTTAHVNSSNLHAKSSQADF